MNTFETRNFAELLVPESEKDKKLQKSKVILGEVTQQMNDEQLQTTITEFEFLGTEWLDEFEREIFDGKTLQELLFMS